MYTLQGRGVAIFFFRLEHMATCVAAQGTIRKWCWATACPRLMLCCSLGHQVGAVLGEVMPPGIGRRNHGEHEAWRDKCKNEDSTLKLL